MSDLKSLRFFEIIANQNKKRNWKTVVNKKKNIWRFHIEKYKIAWLKQINCWFIVSIFIAALFV